MRFPASALAGCIEMSRELNPAAGLDDFGFLDLDAAKRFHRFRTDKQKSSIAKAQLSIAEVLKVIDQRVQTGPDKGAIRLAVADQLTGYRKGLIAYRAIERIGCDDMREDQLLESVDAVLQFLKLVLCNSGHDSESQAVADAGKLISPEQVEHRLSEIQK